MRARPRSCETRLGGFVSLSSRLGCSARRLGSARSGRCFGSSVARRLAGRQLGGLAAPAARAGGVGGSAVASAAPQLVSAGYVDGRGRRDVRGISEVVTPTASATALAQPQRPHARSARGGRSLADRGPFGCSGRSRRLFAVRGGRSRRPFTAAVRGGRSRRPFAAAVRGALRGSAASAASMTAPGQVRSLTFSGFQAPQPRP